MRIRIGNLEIIDPSPEELDQLISRYGQLGDSVAGSPGGGDVQTAQATATDKLPRSGGTTDIVLLRKLVEAGSGGLSVNTVGDLVGKKGKAMRGAARTWAKRISLASNDDHDPFEECRVGTGRGIRIKGSLMEVAQEILAAQGGRK